VKLPLRRDNNPCGGSRKPANNGFLQQAYEAKGRRWPLQRPQINYTAFSRTARLKIAGNWEISSRVVSGYFVDFVTLGNVALSVPEGSKLKPEFNPFQIIVSTY